MAVPNTQHHQNIQEINKGVEAVDVDDSNPLVKHAAFFDLNNDGVIHPWETYKGLRKIGCGVVLSLGFTCFVHIGISQKTRPGKFPSLLLPIEIMNIARAKHGSDSGAYDTQGRFVPQKFEEIFAKHAHTTTDALSWEETKEMLKSNRVPKNYIGWIFAYAEWKALYILCKDKSGFLRKDTMRAMYDGSLFEKMARETASNKKKA